jgi:citrate lyase subunit beta/citryl-CoA lyase
VRALLITPAEETRLAEAFKSGADAVIVDLMAATPDERVAARAAAARFLTETRGRRAGPMLVVRTNGLESGETDADLDAVMGAAPDAILLPRSLGAASVQQLSVKLAVREAELSLADGATGILAVVDTAQSLFRMGSYRGASRRLIGIAWSAERLRTDIGAKTDRDGFGALLDPYRLARSLTLFAASSAGVPAIDTVFRGDAEGLRAESLAARRDGFAAKMAIDPAQAAVINDVFAPP